MSFFLCLCVCVCVREREIVPQNPFELSFFVLFSCLLGSVYLAYCLSLPCQCDANGKTASWETVVKIPFIDERDVFGGKTNAPQHRLTLFVFSPESGVRLAVSCAPHTLCLESTLSCVLRQEAEMVLQDG